MLLQAPLHLPAAPSMDEDLEGQPGWAQGCRGSSGSGGAACLPAFSSIHACSSAGTAASGANCWVRLVQLALA